MSAFSQLSSRASRAGAAAVAVRVPPPKVVLVAPGGFSDGWPNKPTVAVPVGIRLIGLDDIEFARAEASRVASTMHPEERDEKNWIDTFNDTLMRLHVARATCQPDDVSRPYWDVADENVKLALSESGVKALWEAYDDLKHAEDALSPEATDDELAWLAEALIDGSLWAELDIAEAQRTRRLLGRVIATLGQTIA